MRVLFGPSTLGESLVLVARRKDTLVENAHGQWDKPIDVNNAAA
jgi:hypothetical protein